MATLTGTRAAANLPVPSYAGAGVVQAAYGSYTLAANPTANDVIQFCKLPAGAVVLGGFLRGQDIDTGTATFDIDIGWSADTDGFGNFGVLNGTAVTNYLPEGGILVPLNGTLATGVVTFTSETMIQGLVNAAANATGTGTLTVVIYFVVP
jgi:hypothetical protein